MRRITFAISSTIAALVLLFSYRTSTKGSLASAATGDTAKAHVVTSSAAAGTGAASTTSSADPPTTTADGPTDGRITIPSTTPSAAAKSSAKTSAAPSTTAPSTNAPSTAAPSTAAPSAASSTAAGPVVVDGDASMTRFGAVQVEVTLTAGKITAVQAIQYPDREQRDVEINNRALPLLENQVLSAQSAQIDGVSGATYTTEGYVTSLQSALDAVSFS